MSDSVTQLVAATVARTIATGAIVPPAAGTVPTADGAGAAVWSTPGGGSTTISSASWSSTVGATPTDLVHNFGVAVGTVCSVQSESAPNLVVDPAIGIMTFNNPTGSKYLFMYNAQIVPSALGTRIRVYVSVNGAFAIPAGAGHTTVSWGDDVTIPISVSGAALMDIPAGPATAQVAVLEVDNIADQTIRFLDLSCVVLEQLPAPAPP